MPTLDPTTAARIANGVYGIEQWGDLPGQTDPQRIAAGFAARNEGALEQLFDLSAPGVLHARSGALAWKSRTGFALVLPRAGTAEMVIALRGTANLNDGLTDAATAMVPGPGGVVHAGFQRVYAQLIGNVLAALPPNPTEVHVVGHSLGGALANLVAAKLKQESVGDIQLYTFGAPRVGLPGFTSHLSTGSAVTIHRMVNPSDPVPWVPLFPFMHAPASGRELRVSRQDPQLSDFPHFMTVYKSSVRGLDWGQLGARASSIEDRFSVDYWIDRASQYVSFPGSSIALTALGYALKGMLRTAVNTIGLAVAGAATVLDQIASMLIRAAELVTALGERLLSWMRTVLRFAGHGAVVTAQLSRQFLIYALGLLFRPLAAVTRRALRGGLRGR